MQNEFDRRGSAQNSERRKTESQSFWENDRKVKLMATDTMQFKRVVFYCFYDATFYAHSAGIRWWKLWNHYCHSRKTETVPVMKARKLTNAITRNYLPVFSIKSTDHGLPREGFIHVRADEKFFLRSKNKFQHETYFIIRQNNEMVDSTAE